MLSLELKSNKLDSEMKKFNSVSLKPYLILIENSTAVRAQSGFKALVFIPKAESQDQAHSHSATQAEFQKSDNQPKSGNNNTGPLSTNTGDDLAGSPSTAAAHVAALITR